MPRKVKPQIVEEVLKSERLPSQAYANELEEISEEENETPIQPAKKLSEKRLESLKKARQAALIKKQMMKETKDKAKNKEQLELEIKAIEYDKLLEKKQSLQKKDDIEIEPERLPLQEHARERLPSQAHTSEQQKTKPSKKVVKKIIREIEESEEEEEEEEVIVKRIKPKSRTLAFASARERHTQQPTNYNHLLYHTASQQLQEKLLDERAKSLIQSMRPSMI